MRPESGFWISPNWPKTGKTVMTSQFFDIRLSLNFFDVALFLLSSLVTVPIFMSLSSLVLELWQFLFIRDWPKIRKRDCPRLSFAQYLETGRVKKTKFGTNISDKMLLNAAKWQGYSFYRFWVIKGRPIGEGGGGGVGVKLPAPHPLKLGLITRFMKGWLIRKWKKVKVIWRF